MKQLTSTFIGLLICLSVTAQITPVTWDFTTNKVNDQEYDLIFTANLKSGWFIYSQFLSDEGPVPTSININVIDGFEPVGLPTESGNKKEGFDPLFNMDIVKFSGRVVFKQRIKLTQELEEITGFVEYMTCDDEKCLPPTDVEFVFSFKKG